MVGSLSIILEVVGSNVHICFFFFLMRKTYKGSIVVVNTAIQTVLCMHN